MPDMFNEYTQGLSVEQDVPDHYPAPVYTSTVFRIEDVLRSDHPVAANHREMYKQAAIQSFVTLPLLNGGESIGYQFISARCPRAFTEAELTFFSAASEYLVRELASIKSFMIRQLEQSR